MRLRRVKYGQYEGTAKEWTLDSLLLQKLNLIVGRNATGKSRTINVLNGLAALLGGRMKAGQLSSAHYEVVFESSFGEVQYNLRIQNHAVVLEEYTVDGRKLLQRGEGGTGTIEAVKLGGPLDFQAPSNELAVVVRRDSVQHPFLEHVHTWAESVLHYQFGTDFGKDRFAIVLEEPPPFDVKDTLNVLGMFRQGRDRHPDHFVAAVISDMKRVGYDLEEVGFCAPTTVNIQVSVPLPGVFQYLFVKERGLGHRTEQSDMSQGMFRVFALLIDLNFAVLEIKPACFLVDDVGEGLDFERSCLLIDVLMEKAASSGVQLVMATNDRFVMNRVNLQAWTVLTRNGHGCDVRNYENSKSQFDHFAFTGLNNFDFLATNFLDDEDDLACSKSDS